MKNKNTSLTGLIISVSSILIGIVSLLFLPEKIPLNFNFDGDVSAYGSKWTILLISMLPGALYYGVNALRFIDPKKENYKKFETVFDILRILISAFILVMEIATIIFSFFPQSFNIYIIISAMTGLLVFIFGNYLPKLRHNFFCGIRTPWTLTSEICWVKTHRFSGKLWVIGGALIFIFSALLRGAVLYYAMLAVALGLLFLVPCIYSYFIYAEEKRAGK